MSNKKALGRGLSALFENNDNDENENLDSINKAKDKTPPPAKPANEAPVTPTPPVIADMPYQLLAVDIVKANVNQPRSFFDEEKLNELAKSIKEYGIIEPIIVNKAANGKHFEIIAGERRLRAAKLAGIKEIPAVIKNVNNTDLLEIMLIENLQREDLTVLEEAESYATIIEKKNLTQDQLAERIGKSRSHITNTMRILKAPLAVKKLLAENKLSSSQVRTIVNLPEEEMIQLAQETVSGELTVRELEQRVKHLWNGKGKSKGKKNLGASNLDFGTAQKDSKGAKDPNILEIEELYRNRLKTKVTICPIKNKQGKIEIEYYHYDELLGILSRISEIDEN